MLPHRKPPILQGPPHSLLHALAEERRENVIHDAVERVRIVARSFARAREDAPPVEAL